MKITATLTTIFFCALTVAEAEETLQVQAHHGHMAAPDTSHYTMPPEMHKQHQTMTNINKSWTEAKIYLQGNSLSSATKSIDSMLQSAEYLSKFMLHKNADQMDVFLLRGRALIKCLEDLKQACNSGNNDLIMKSMQAVDDSCKNCHSKFR